MIPRCFAALFRGAATRDTCTRPQKRKGKGESDSHIEVIGVLTGNFERNSYEGSEACFSKVPKRFRVQKAITNIFKLNLCLQNYSFHTILIRTKLTSMQGFMPIHGLLFEIHIIKNDFTGPISYRDFRETGPRISFCGRGHNSF